MAIKITKTGSRSKGLPSALNQIQPDRQFGSAVASEVGAAPVAKLSDDMVFRSQVYKQTADDLENTSKDIIKTQSNITSALEESRANENLSNLRLLSSTETNNLNELKIQGKIQPEEIPAEFERRMKGHSKQLHDKFKWTTPAGSASTVNQNNFIRGAKVVKQTDRLNDSINKVKAQLSSQLEGVVKAGALDVESAAEAKANIADLTTSSQYTALYNTPGLDRATAIANIEKGLIDTLMETDPGAAIDALKDKNIIATLEPEVIAQQITRAEGRVFANNERREITIVGDTRLGIKDSWVTEKYIKSLNISPARQASLLSGLTGTNARVLQIRNDYNEIEQNRISQPGGLNFTTDKQNQNKVDAWYEAKKNQQTDESDEEKSTRLVIETAQVGMIPSEIKQQMLSGITSDSPSRFNIAAKTVLTYQRENPYILRNINPQVLASAEMAGRGRSFEQIKMIREKTASMSKEQTKIFNADVKKQFKDIPVVDQISDFIDADFYPNSIQDDYKSIYANNLLLTDGDQEAATSLTRDSINRLYSITTITGSERIQKYAPEAMYGTGGSTEYMKKQLAFDLNKFGLNSEKVRLDINTDSLGTNDVSYNIFDLEQNTYVRDTRNNMINWRPDQAVFNADTLAGLSKERQAEIKKSRTSKAKFIKRITK